MTSFVHESFAFWRISTLHSRHLTVYDTQSPSVRLVSLLHQCRLAGQRQGLLMLAYKAQLVARRRQNYFLFLPDSMKL